MVMFSTSSNCIVHLSFSEAKIHHINHISSQQFQKVTISDSFRLNMAPGPPSPSLMEQTCTNLKLALSKSGGIPSEQLSCKSGYIKEAHVLYLIQLYR